MLKHFLIFLLLVALPSYGQQQANQKWRPQVADPTWPSGKGPRIALDEAHNNFHTLAGRYGPFGKLLTLDGFVVKANTEPLTKEFLFEIRVLVISNALHESNTESWSLPTPSCFSEAEVAAVVGWIEMGGSLLLIADHMPFPGAVSELARALNVTFSNGYAADGNKARNLTFSKASGSLAEHVVTQGVAQVMSFTGSAFKVARAHHPLITLPPGSQSLEPKTAWEFNEQTKKVDVGGWLQGAVFQKGEGRVAVFGEAAMFTAQQVGERSFGMSAPGAQDNARFLRNVMRWLAGE